MTTEIRIIQCGDPQADHLEQFKQYASVPDDSRDGVLLKMLKRAMLSVQEFSDTAILPCKFEMTVVDVYRDEYVRLYQGGKTYRETLRDLYPFQFGADKYQTVPAAVHIQL